MRAVLLLLALLASTATSAADAAAPREKRVTLGAFTQLTLDIVPDLGTRLVFPFVLDERPSSGLPFVLKLTNAVFQNYRPEGRNFLVITAPPQADVAAHYLGDLFITVGPYNISVRLRTTNNLAQHYTDIVFELNEHDRFTLVNDEVARQMVALRADYAKKEEALEREAARLALAKIGTLALVEPETITVREEARLDLPGGDRVSVYLDKLLRYGDYWVLPIDVTADTSSDIKVQDVRLFGRRDEGEPDQLLDAPFTMRPRVAAGDRVRGVLATQAPNLPDFPYLKIAILTDKGTLELAW